MGFNFNSLYRTDGYKVGHQKMLAKNTTRLYGTWIPRKIKYAHFSINKIVSFGQQMTIKFIHDDFEDNFFNKDISEVDSFIKDMSDYLGLPYDGEHFKELHKLGYLPIKVQALPEGIETLPNIPHMTFINTVDGFAWLTLYLETLFSSLAWKPSTSATIALRYRRNVEEWVNKTDANRGFLIPWMCHDFSARGLSPWDMISSGLGHATSFRGSDTLSVIPAARYFYNETAVAIGSVNASEHSVSTTKIFTVGEKQMLSDWLKDFPSGILSVVSDTFDLFQLITVYLPELKEEILAREGKLVIRPDSGNPADILCGEWSEAYVEEDRKYFSPKEKGVIELLWDIFGGIVNPQGYKVLDSHIGAIYGDAISLDRQIEIYERLESKGFAATNVVLGIGSFTYQFNSRDTLGWAAKGAWFETYDEETGETRGYNIYKDPVTDSGTKKSLKGFQFVGYKNGEYYVESEVSEEKAYSKENWLQVIYVDGIFPYETSLTAVREEINYLFK